MPPAVRSDNMIAVCGRIVSLRVGGDVGIAIPEIFMGGYVVRHNTVRIIRNDIACLIQHLVALYAAANMLLRQNSNKLFQEFRVLFHVGIVVFDADGNASVLVITLIKFAVFILQVRINVNYGIIIQRFTAIAISISCIFHASDCILVCRFLYKGLLQTKLEKFLFHTW